MNDQSCSKFSGTIFFTSTLSQNDDYTMIERGCDQSNLLEKESAIIVIQILSTKTSNSNKPAEKVPLYLDISKKKRRPAHGRHPRLLLIILLTYT